MNQLFACAACQRYIREAERHCPFCGESVALVAERSPSLPLPRGRSRAANFAMRTALAAGIAPAFIACGGQSDARREQPEEVSGNGGAPQSGSGGSSGAIATNGGSSNGGSASGAGGANVGSGGTIELSDAGPADPTEEPDGGFAPVPIYGGVFPDPLSRVRV